MSVRLVRSEYERGIFQGGGGKKGAESGFEEYYTNKMTGDTAAGIACEIFVRCPFILDPI